MQVLKFIKKQLNFSKRWIVAVAGSDETLTSEGLMARLMHKHGHNRKEISELTTQIKEEILSELLAGNAVDVFGLVKIKVDFSLRKKFVGSEEEADVMAAKLSARDIKTQLKATINQTFNHRYVKMRASVK